MISDDIEWRGEDEETETACSFAETNEVRARMAALPALAALAAGAHEPEFDRIIEQAALALAAWKALGALTTEVGEAESTFVRLRGERKRAWMHARSMQLELNTLVQAGVKDQDA